MSITARYCRRLLRRLRRPSLTGSPWILCMESGWESFKGGPRTQVFDAYPFADLQSPVQYRADGTGKRWARGFRDVDCEFRWTLDGKQLTTHEDGLTPDTEEILLLTREKLVVRTHGHAASIEWELTCTYDRL